MNPFVSGDRSGDGSNHNNNSRNIFTTNDRDHDGFSVQRMLVEQYKSMPNPFGIGNAPLTENCLVKGVLSAGMGFLLGNAMGLFLSSMQFTDFSSTVVTKDGQTKTIAELPFRQQVRESFRDMGKRSFSMGKNFALVGTIYATTECIIEGYRAKHDIVNSVASGCVSGAILGIQGGPQSAAFGCAGFAAFSAAIDYFMDGH